MNKESQYNRIFRQVEDLFKKVDNPLSRMATINALLYYKMQDIYWVGNYLLYPDRKLLVGPYQGTLACMELKINIGVCWAAINSAKSVVVSDVSKFEGHIACDPKSKSEIAIPIFNSANNSIVGVLDIDSERIDNFDAKDQIWLEKIVSLI